MERGKRCVNIGIRVSSTCSGIIVSRGDSTNETGFKHGMLVNFFDVCYVDSGEIVRGSPILKANGQGGRAVRMFPIDCSFTVCFARSSRTTRMSAFALAAII